MKRIAMLTASVMIIALVLLLIFTYFYKIQNQPLMLVYDENLSSENIYWDLLGWGDSAAYQEWQNGIAYLNVSNSNGKKWAGSKLQQGSDPHGWHQAKPLKRELKLSRSFGVFPENLRLELRLKVGNYSFLRYPSNPPSNYSWFNIAIGFWLERLNTHWDSNDSQMCAGLNIVWLKHDGNQTSPQLEDVYFQGDVGNDLHSLFDVCDETIMPLDE